MQLLFRAGLGDWLQQPLHDQAELPVVEAVAQKHPAALRQPRENIRGQHLHLVAREPNEGFHQVLFGDRQMFEL